MSSLDEQQDNLFSQQQESRLLRQLQLRDGCSVRAQAQKSAQEEQRQKKWQQLEQAANKQLHSSANLIGNAAR